MMIRQAPTQDTDKFSLQLKRTAGFDKKVLDLEVLPLTETIKEEITGKSACQTAGSPDQPLNAPVVGTIAEQPAQPEQQQPEDQTNTDMYREAGPEAGAFVDDLTPEKDQKSRLVKRGLMTWSFVRDSGLLEDMPENAAESHCFVAKFTLPAADKVKLGNVYGLKLKVHKGFLRNSDFSTRKVTIIKPKTSRKGLKNEDFLDQCKAALGWTTAKSQQLAERSAQETKRFMGVAGQHGTHALAETKKYGSRGVQQATQWGQQAGAYTTQWGQQAGAYTAQTWDQLLKKLNNKKNKNTEESQDIADAPMTAADTQLTSAAGDSVEASFEPFPEKRQQQDRQQ